MKRVLHIVSSMNCGGIETFIMNLYREIDRQKLQFDFLVNTDKESFYDQEIYELGGRIYKVCTKRDNAVKNFFQVKKIIQENKYDVIHRHGSNGLIALDILAAKLAGATIRIAHSHNIRASGFQPVHKYLKKIIPHVTTNRVACSTEAGNHLFNDNDFVIMKNTIDSHRFIYDEDEREEIRKELKIQENKLVIGNIGRFHNQKNHLFLIDIFYELHKINPDSILLLVGEGNLKHQVEKKVSEMRLGESVKFLGLRSDVYRIMQAFDSFLFPSLYEGLGIVLLEAQASGLPCITSEKVVPKEVEITDLMEFVPLERSAKEWAEIVLSCTYNKGPRRDRSKEVIASGYDVRSNLRIIEGLYDVQ